MEPLFGSGDAARAEIYKGKEQESAKVPRGLTPDVLEKLQKPSVRRLANVTQLCMFFLVSEAGRQSH